MKLLRKWWNLLGQIMGEGEYVRYCEHMISKHPGIKIPTAKEFYVSRLKERYSRPNRCC
jgi:uncharacterized short protein YbdD (DUF466 family)